MEAIIGLNKLNKKLENLTSVQTAEKAMTTSVLLLERDAKEECPVDTGALRRSITSEVTSSDKRVTGRVFTPVEYAPWVHYGTGIYSPEGRTDVPWKYQDEKGDWHTTYGQKPNPFMDRALYKNEGTIQEIFKKEYEEVLNNG